MIESSSIVYRKTVRPRQEAPDGESPTQVVLTHEVNGFIIWFSEPCDYGDVLIDFVKYRDDAIEKAIAFAQMPQADIFAIAKRKAIQ